MKSVKSFHPCKSVIQTVYDIVKAHGGTIEVKSLPAGQIGKVDTGTEFVINLPTTNE